MLAIMWNLTVVNVLNNLSLHALHFFDTVQFHRLRLYFLTYQSYWLEPLFAAALVTVYLSFFLHSTSRYTDLYFFPDFIELFVLLPFFLLRILNIILQIKVR